MAEQKRDSAEEVLIKAPFFALQEIGELFRNFFTEVGSMFWFIIHTFEETLERLREGRVPFRANSFFRHAERAGGDSVPLAAPASFFFCFCLCCFCCFTLR